MVLAIVLPFCVHAAGQAQQDGLTYRVVDTGVVTYYGNSSVIQKPLSGKPFYGQDAQFQGNLPSYTDNKDGTITDNVTGLMWQKNMGEKIPFDQAFQQAQMLSVGGYRDWRVPTIKELYSLIQFTGKVSAQKAITPFIDTKYFDQPTGNPLKGEREIDAQTWSSTEYVSKTMKNDVTIFGVNFIDGRIKGYPKYNPRTGSANKMYFRFVRGNTDYGKNKFVDNMDGTVTDSATGLIWQKADSGKGMNWKEALLYAESLDLAGYNDWRLPDAKELQSIADYDRSPDATGSPALNPVFQTTPIVNEASKKDFPYFWSSTTHLDGPVPEASAVYIAFGRALGKMHGTVMDVHGAGSQRSDPKTGSPMFRGPQGDVIRVKNHVRCVRGGSVKLNTTTPVRNKNISSFNARTPDISHPGQTGSNGKPIISSGRKAFVERLDKDGDGRVSRLEFDGPKDRFYFHDKNKDGYLTDDEAPRGPKPPRGQMPQRHF